MADRQRWKGLRILTLASVCPVAMGVAPVRSQVVVEASASSPLPEEFRRYVEHELDALRKSGVPGLVRLLAAADAAPARIAIRPITDDRATWHPDGDRTRSHTEPVDGKPKRLGRSRPTAAIVHLNPDRVDPGDGQSRGVTLVHELVHAVDLAYGRYSPEQQTRERRAVFFENLARDWRKRKLRLDYHDRFPTLDYTVARQGGAIDRYVDHILQRDGLPR